MGWIDDPIGQFAALFGTGVTDPPKDPPPAPAETADAPQAPPPLTAADMAAAGITEPRISTFLDPLNAACVEFQITTPIRAACFLATVTWESEDFRYMREIWGPTPAQAGYEGNVQLGNTKPGDGYRFRGAGLIEVTGRYNHQQVATYFGMSIDQVSDWMATPIGACRSAGLFWQQKNMNYLADNENDEAIRRKVNGGLNGFTQFLNVLTAIKKEMGLS